MPCAKALNQLQINPCKLSATIFFNLQTKKKQIHLWNKFFFFFFEVVYISFRKIDQNLKKLLLLRRLSFVNFSKFQYSILVFVIQVNKKCFNFFPFILVTRMLNDKRNMMVYGDLTIAWRNLKMFNGGDVSVWIWEWAHFNKCIALNSIKH